MRSPTSQPYRLISVLKVRDSAFDPSIHSYAMAANGIVIAPDTSLAESVPSRLVSRADGSAPVYTLALQPRGSG